MMQGRDPCDRFAAAVLDAQAPRPPGFEEHLAACPRCRALLDAHRAAARLPREPVRAPAPWPLEAIVARVRRRRRVRAAVGAGAVAAVVAALLLARLPARTPPPASGGDLFALADTVAAYGRRDVASDDPTIDDAAPLAGWFAAPRRLPLELSSYAPSIGPARGELP